MAHMAGHASWGHGRYAILLIPSALLRRTHDCVFRVHPERFCRHVSCGGFPFVCCADFLRLHSSSQGRSKPFQFSTVRDEREGARDGEDFS